VEEECPEREWSEHMTQTFKFLDKVLSCPKAYLHPCSIYTLEAVMYGFDCRNWCDTNVFEFTDRFDEFLRLKGISDGGVSKPWAYWISALDAGMLDDDLGRFEELLEEFKCRGP